MRKLILSLLATAFFSGCAKDLIVDFGGGDSIRFVGMADNFDCDDPAYAKVDKTHTFSMVFPDGTTTNLCSKKQSGTPTQPQTLGSSGVSGVAAPLYTLPAGDATDPVLHAIGVTQALKNEVVVDITDDRRPIILALSAYEKTLWKIRLAPRVRLDSVILSGYHTQRVSGIPATVPIHTYTHDPSPCDQCVPGSKTFYFYDKPHEELKSITGLDITSFQGPQSGNVYFILDETPR